MRNGLSIAVIIPAFNEEPSIGKVISAIPDWVDDVIVADNGSTDSTANIARGLGARVVAEPERGYGAACLAGIDALDDQDIVVFLDGDFSDYPEEMNLLVDPIADGRADMVIGSRTIGEREPGALTPQALFGNWLSCMLMRWFWSVSYSDLGPFRAIRRETLTNLAMCDRNFGWTVEMQIKAARAGARACEVAVSYRKRVGKSKISGTVRGVVGAGTKILSTIFRAAAGPLPGERDSRTGDRGKRDGKTSNRLIIFTRYPEPGSTKTRLIPALGPEGAAGLHRRMAERAVGFAKELSRRMPVLIEIAFEGGLRRDMKNWLGPGLNFCKQPGGGLGERMHESFARAFGEGRQKVVLAGTDCPGISADIFEKAFAALDGHDLVLGPAEDGGYYLVGMKRPTPEIFDDMPWGTGDVLDRTLDAARRLGLSAALVDKLADVDRPEDLGAWKRATGESATRIADPRISIIIPSYNEADCVGEAIASARLGEHMSGVEIIVVDGGSSDNTAGIAEEAGARVIVAGLGRAAQMNAGAAEAGGDILVFLHADTRLPDGYIGLAVRTLERPDVAAGAFRLRIGSPRPSLRFIEFMANLRSTALKMPYGDQALFMRTNIFRELGGFPDIPIMEDFELARRLRRRGRIVTIPASVMTSPRRWHETGVIRTTITNRAAIIAYFLGVPIRRIAGLYKGAAEQQKEG
jgi:hypothetical protein